MKAVILDGYTVNPGDLSWEGIEETASLTVYDRTARIRSSKGSATARRCLPANARSPGRSWTHVHPSDL